MDILLVKLPYLHHGFRAAIVNSVLEHFNTFHNYTTNAVTLVEVNFS
jgi:hypothetical protein